MKFPHGVKNIHVVVGAGIVRIEHETDILGDISAKVESDVVQRKLIGGIASSG